MDLVSAMQYFFDAHLFADRIFIGDPVFHFHSLCDFAMQMHDELSSPLACTSAALSPRHIPAMDCVEGSGQRLRVRGRWPQVSNMLVRNATRVRQMVPRSVWL